MTLAANLAALARRVVGISANNLVALDGSAKLPAVDGSLLTGLALGGIKGVRLIIRQSVERAGEVLCRAEVTAAQAQMTPMNR